MCSLEQTTAAGKMSLGSLCPTVAGRRVLSQADSASSCRKQLAWNCGDEISTHAARLPYGLAPVGFTTLHNLAAYLHHILPLLGAPIKPAPRDLARETPRITVEEEGTTWMQTVMASAVLFFFSSTLMHSVEGLDQAKVVGLVSLRACGVTRLDNL